MDENSITLPSKCTKVMMNNIWSEREQVIIEQCTENSSVSHVTISSSVSVVPDEKVHLDQKVNPTEYIHQI